jgi:hypothetical protein
MEQFWLVTTMGVWFLAGVGIYLGSQSRKHVLVTNRERFWLRVIGSLILTYQILGFYVYYTLN